MRQNLLVVFTDENIKMLSTPVNVYQYITLSVKPHLEPHLTSVCHNKTLASSYSVKPSYHQAPDTDSKTSLSLSRLQLYLCTHLSVLSPRNNPGKTETLCVSQSGPAHKQGDLGCHVLTLRVAPSLECTSAGFFWLLGWGYQHATLPPTFSKGHTLTAPVKVNRLDSHATNRAALLTGPYLAYLIKPRAKKTVPYNATRNHTARILYTV